jgi:hypothetical protein
MLSRQNQELLEEIYKATKMGMEATQLVIPKIHNSDLKEDIEAQCDSYAEFAEKSERMLKQNHKEPDKQNPLQKATLWGAIELNTLANTSTEHIAEIMINGTTMGIVDLTKKLNELDEVDAGSKKLAMEWVPEVVQTAAGPTRTMAPRPKEAIEELELPQVETDWSDFYYNVLGVIDEGKELIVKPSEVMRVFKVMEACFASDETGRTIEVNI